MHRHKQKNANYGITLAQEKQRQATLRLLEQTIQEMQQKHLPITKTSVADEAGVSRQSLYAPYIKDFLDGHPAFQTNLAKADKSPPTIAYLQIENEKQKQKLLSLQEELRKTKKLLQMSKQSYAELNREYQKLLGRYQTDVGQKFIHF
ncbi:hypothetical protein [Phocaeicola sp.]|uniref:hypothetical protein n=1 Tax=Phocaeicola sp. TaxID=2773926 RepID=UPI003AB80FAE